MSLLLFVFLLLNSLSYGETALHKAARVASVELVKLLVSNGASTEIEGSSGKVGVFFVCLDCFA